MYGGVGGEDGQPSPLSRFYKLFSGRSFASNLHSIGAYADGCISRRTSIASIK